MFRLPLAILILLLYNIESTWTYETFSKKEVTQKLLELSTAVRDLKTGVQRLENKTEPLGKRSAFLAQADKSKYTYYPGFSRLVFRKVLFNIGSGYNPETSVFTAPYAGVYIFSYQVFPAFGNYVRVDIKRNGETLLRSRMLGIEDGNGKLPVSTAASVTAHAQHGDQFWLEIADGAGNYWGLYHTFFSGTLVSAD